jgi:tetratricopeptide (TPR) repeat protein
MGEYTTCEGCRKRGSENRTKKKEEPVIKCAKEGCSFKKSEENTYCGKHQLYVFINETAEMGLKTCKNAIRGCRAQLSQDYSYTGCENCLEKDRENCTTQVYLGRAFLEAADSEAALSQLERAISFCSQADSDLGHYYSAIALYRSKQPEKAQLRFEELVVLFPNGPNQEKAKKMIDIIKKSRQ